MDRALQGAMGFVLMTSETPVKTSEVSLKLLVPKAVMHLVDFLIARQCKGEQLLFGLHGVSFILESAAALHVTSRECH